MAKSSRRGRAPEIEEEMEEPMAEGGGNPVETLMTALLIVAFGFIFVGIILTSWTLHQNFDTPFLGMFQKDAGETVKAMAKKDYLKESGQEVAGDDEEEDYEEGGEEGTDEYEEEYEEEE